MENKTTEEERANICMEPHQIKTPQGLHIYKKVAEKLRNICVLLEARSTPYEKKHGGGLVSASPICMGVPKARADEVLAATFGGPSSSSRAKGSTLVPSP